MKYKLIIFLGTVFILLNVTSAISQSKVNIDDLIGKKWCFLNKESISNVGNEWTKDSYKVFIDDKNISDAKYYLSNTPDEKFKDNKVGKMKKGRYLVYSLSNHEKFPNKTECLEIIDFKNDTLTIRNIKVREPVIMVLCE
ncbi:hypothetical protein [Portibacter lacus]|uniref:Uncharacterized protein n=1 Tax=Portibacter lacus TaxID=1099794 RepID=A0AA37SP10_9BACT|nr:hypothetical protein [Portibacter lacus]GLR16479.1 hypothetical protein GCM10007940_10940 [Portibacter lacus]